MTAAASIFASSPQTLFHRQPGSEEDTGPYLNVVTWILLITSSLAVLTRLITKRALNRRIDIDDTFVLAALATSIASGASVSIQIANGLGRSVSVIDRHQLMVYQKGDYANKLLYLATLVFAKLSIISLLRMLTASTLHRLLGIALTALIVFWGLGSEVVVAVQCGTSKPWDFMDAGDNCIDLISFWRCMCIFNMVTDLALILFPVHVIVTLKLSVGKKITILIFFGARFLDIIASALQLVYLSGFSSLNATKELWKWTLLTQVIECLAILTSCVPYLRPLLESLPSGMYSSHELRRRGTPSELGYTKTRNGSYQLSSSTSKTRPGTEHSRKTDLEAGLKRFLPMIPQGRTSHSNSASGLPGGPRRPDGYTGVEITAVSRRSREDTNWGTGSSRGQAKILKTTVMSTEWEAAGMYGSDMCSDGSHVAIHN